MNAKRVAILFVAIAVVMGLFYFANRYQVNRNASTMLDSAKKAIENGNRAEALALYMKYLNFRPRDTLVMADYAQLLDDDSQVNPKSKRELIDCYERLLNIAPTRSEERRKLIKIYMDYNYFAGAKLHLSQMVDPLKGQPNDVEMLDLLATCELRMGKLTEGMEKLQRIVKTGKGPSEAYLKLAMLLRTEIKTKEAFEEADGVIDQLARDKSDDITARITRAKYLFAKGEPAQAREEIRNATTSVRDPEKYPEFVLLLTEVYAADNRLADARSILGKAVQVNPNNTRLRSVYSEVLIRLNQVAEADEQLQAAVKMTAENDLFAVELVDRLIDRKDLFTARAETTRRFSKREVFRPTFDYLNGRIFLAEGKWHEAIPRLKAALPAFEKWAKLYAKAQLSLGECYSYASNPERMYEAYHRSSQVDPESILAQIGMANAFIKLGRGAQAVPILQRYAETIPAARFALLNLLFQEQAVKLPSIRKWTAFDAAIGKPPYTIGVELLRGQALLMQEKPEEAIAFYRDLVKRAPDEASPRIAIAAILAQSDSKAGLDVLDTAEKALGDKVAIRLARSTYILRKSPPDAAAIVALGDKAEAFSVEDRYSLHTGLGDLLYQFLGKRTEAAALFQKATAEKPYDLASRMSLVQIYLEENRSDDALKVLGEVKALEGEDGPNFLFGQVLVELSNTAPGDKAKIVALRPKLENIIGLRETWSRPHSVLGSLADMVGEPATALVHFRKAYDLGDRSELVYRRLVLGLVSSGRMEEARRLLEGRSQTAGLPDDLRQQLAIIDAATGTRNSDATLAMIQKLEKSDNPREQLFRANWLQMNGKRAEAILAFEKATTLAPTSPDNWIGLIAAQASAGDMASAKTAYQKAETALTAAVASFQNRADLPAVLGRAQEILGENLAAERIYLDGLKTHADEPGLIRALAELYLRTSQLPAADAQCERLIKTNAPDVQRRWARRTLAANKVQRPDGYSQLPSALALLDENLKSGTNPEDVRAKAFALTVDPFRRAEAKKLIEDSVTQDPLPLEDSAKLAMLYFQEGNANAAENTLRLATRGPVSLNYLVLLHQMQVQANKKDAARQTLDRVREMAPKTWPAISEEARYKAKFEDKKLAAKGPLAFAAANEPAMLLSLVGPLLVDIGCTAEAEEVYRRAADTTKLPNRFLGLALFYIQTGDQMKAIATIRGIDDKEITVPQRGQLYKNAVAMRVRPNVPAAERAEWDRTILDVSKWIDEQAALAPKDSQWVLAQAMVFESREQYDDAIRAYEKTLASEPNQVVALNNLAVLLILHRNDATPRPTELIEKAIARVGPQPYLLDTRAMARTATGKFEDAVADVNAALRYAQKPVYGFHALLAEEKAENRVKMNEFRDLAIRYGIKKNLLHPKEWPDYDRLFGGM